MAPSRHHVAKPPNPENDPPAQDESEEEDDYMTMALPTEQPQKETPIQRLQRQKREALARGNPKSRAELAIEERARREEAHSRSLLDQESSKSSKGLAMMAKMGFRGGALGRGEGVKEPIRVEVKEGRAGIGLEEERKKREREEEDEAIRIGKRAKKVDEGEYRERVAKEREAERVERQYRAAAKLAQQLQEQKEEDEAEPEPEPGARPAPIPGMPDPKNKKAAPPLSSVNILWRPLVKEREQAERDRADRRAREENLTGLPHYEEELEREDRVAMGKDEVEPTAEEAPEGDADEDAELEEFEALEPQERLTKVLEFMRGEHRYCFWCKSRYPDAEMEGCPGITEEDHD